MGYQNVLRPLAYLLNGGDAEAVHDQAYRWLEWLQQNPSLLRMVERQCSPRADVRLQTTMFGQKLAHPLGLAPGFDKHGKLPLILPALGFSSVEVGGITKVGQPGNPKTRMLRNWKLGAIWNAMGFNNDGADVTAERLAAFAPRFTVPIGLNLAKGKDTPLENVAEEYCYTLQQFFPYISFAVANVSSPNTAGLRNMQSQDHLFPLMQALQDLNRTLAARYEIQLIELGMKFAPDGQTDESLSDGVTVAEKTGCNFMVLTNTTAQHADLPWPGKPCDRGGASGRPLRERSLAIQKEVYRELVKRGLKGKIKIIGSGGVMDGYDLHDRIAAGASHVQAYTGWIVRGPDFVRMCLRQFLNRMEENGQQTIDEVIGCAA